MELDPDQGPTSGRTSPSPAGPGIPRQKAGAHPRNCPPHLPLTLTRALNAPAPHRTAPAAGPPPPRAQRWFLSVPMPIQPRARARARARPRIGMYARTVIGARGRPRDHATARTGARSNARVHTSADPVTPRTRSRATGTGCFQTTPAPIATFVSLLWLLGRARGYGR